jgi:hypothetical protein
MDHMHNLAEREYAERMIDLHRDEVISQRRVLGPGMLFTDDTRLDTERRIAENEQWVKRWTERRDRLQVAIR